MKFSKKETVDEAESTDLPPTPFTQYLGRFILTSMTLVLIAWLGVMMIPRTQGFRDVLQNRLSKQLGFPISLEKVFVKRNFDLVVEGARIGVSDDSSKGGLSIDEALIHWSPFAFFWSDEPSVHTIDIDGFSLVFQQVEDGTWEPAPFAELSSLLDEFTGFKVEMELGRDTPEEEPALAEEPKDMETVIEKKSQSVSLFDHCRLTVKDGHISWRNQEGQVEALMEGFNLAYSPFHTADRDFQHIKLNIANAQSKKSPAMKGVRFEMMFAKNNKILLGFNAADYGPPGIRLGRLAESQEAKLEPVVNPVQPDDEARKQAEDNLKKKIKEELLESVIPKG